MKALLSRRGCSRRPKRAMRDAPASAKERAVSAPMPVPPPVTATVLPLAESSGRVGDMDGYVFWCQIAVGDGKGAMVVSRCVNDEERWIDCLMKVVDLNC